MIDRLSLANQGQRAAAFTAVIMVAACGSSNDTTATTGTAERGGEGSDGGCGAGARPNTEVDGAIPEPSCEPIVQVHPIEGNQHVPLCSPLTYGTNPPSSGNHYAIWAAYQTYTTPFPRGFWVHNLEHGAIVMTYNCPQGCTSEVERAQAFIDALPADCGPGARRIILVPDPELDVRFAASAWGSTLKAKCFDRDAFSCFVAAHYGHAPESICATGIDPTGGPGEMPICP